MTNLDPVKNQDFTEYLRAKKKRRRDASWAWVHAEMTHPTYLKVVRGEPVTDDEMTAWKARS